MNPIAPMNLYILKIKLSYIQLIIFFIISGKETKGYFIDFPSRIKYDVGYYNENYFNIEIYGEDFYIYIIEGKDAKEVSEKFLEIIGRSYIPPLNGLLDIFKVDGGYKDREEVRKVYENFRKKMISHWKEFFLDLDYMENFKDFTISEERFSGFEDFVEDLKKRWIIFSSYN